MGSHLKKESVPEQLFKLDPGDKALSQHGAAVLEHETEIGFHSRIEDYEGFAQKGAVFRASDVEGVGHLSDVRKLQIIFLAG